MKVRPDTAEKEESKVKIGAHVSTSGGISKAVGRGQEIGCEALQIFGSSPQSWAFREVPDAEVEAFRQGLADAGMGPVFLHAIYLVNLGSNKPDVVEKGVKSLSAHLNLAARLGADGLIFHPGSHGGAGFEAILPQVAESIQRALDGAPEGPCLAVENMAGMGKHIGGPDSRSWERFWTWWTTSGSRSASTRSTASPPGTI